MTPIRRTSALTLTIMGGAGLVIGRAVRPLVESSGGIAPTVGWGPTWSLAFGAVIVAGIAWSTFQSLHRRDERMTSDHGIKLLSLAKASAMVGILVAGGYAGYAIAFLDAYETPLGHDRVVHSFSAAAAAGALMVAALLLERACQLPGDSDDDEDSKDVSDRERDDGAEGSPA